MLANKTWQGGNNYGKKWNIKKSTGRKGGWKRTSSKGQIYDVVIYTMVFMAAIFSFIRSEQGLPMMDLSATVSASVFAGMTYRFIKTKKKENAIIALVMLSVVVIATISFFMGH